MFIHLIIGNPTGGAMPSMIPQGSGVPPGAPPQGPVHNAPVESQVRISVIYCYK